MNAVAIGQAPIGQQAVVAVQRKTGFRLREAAGLIDIPAVRADQIDQKGGGDRVVVDYQAAAHGLDCSC